MIIKGKKRGLGLETKTFLGMSGRSYIVFRTRQGAFHVFQEVEAKEAARDCAAKQDRNTRVMWSELWRKTK